MRISDALAGQRPFFSFEFFPPKDDEGLATAFSHDRGAAALAAGLCLHHVRRRRFDSGRTVALAKEIQQQIGLTVVAHVTCIGATRADLRALFDDVARAGIENVLALRGDPPAGAQFEAVPGGFAHATDLIAMLRRNYGFCIGAACYPEKHPEASSMEA